MTFHYVHSSLVERANADDVRERLKLGDCGGQALRPGKDAKRHHHIFVRSGIGPFRTGAICQVPTEFNPADIATKALDQMTIQKHLAACGVDVKRAADNNEVSHLTSRTQQAPAWIPAPAGLQACIQGLASLAATCPL